MTRAAIVLQARMGSEQLPGKVLAQVGERPILVHCLTRLAERSGLPVIVATTDRPEDDVLCRTAAELGAPVIRGSSDDVLARYVLAVSTFGLTHVVRATADNPAVDLDGPRRTLGLLRRTGVGYVAEFGLPVGAAVEACTAEALCFAHHTTSDAYDREHVTSFLRRDRRVASLQALAPTPLRRADIRLTVDRTDDLAAIRDIFDAIGTQAPRAPLTAFIEAADRVRARQLVHGALGR